MVVEQLSTQVEWNFCVTLSNPYRPKPLNGPMPGMSPLVSHLVNRPSNIGLTVVVHSLFMGSVFGAIHIVFFPCQTPMPLARYSCILPGIAACMHACISASVQPGGSFICGCPAPL